MSHLYLLILITILCHTLASGGRVALALYAIKLGASPFSVGLVMGIYGVLPMFFSVAAGRLSDRVGASRPTLIGAAGMAVGTLLPFLFPGIPALYAASCCIGFGFMFYNIAMQNVSGLMGPPEDRAANLSLIALGFSLSNLFGPTLAGLAIDAIGHRYTFGLFFLLPLFPVAALATSLLPLPRVPRDRAAAGGQRILDLLRDRTLLRIFVTTGMLSCAWELFTFLTPVYGSSIGLSATAIGLIMGSFSAAILAIRIVLPSIANRLDPLRAIAVTLFYSGAIFVLYPLASDAWLLAGLSFLLGLGLGIPQPLVIMLLHSHVPAGRVGEAIGLRHATIYASQSFMPMLFGAMGAALGMAPVFWASALCFAAAGFYGRRPVQSSRPGR